MDKPLRGLREYLDSEYERRKSKNPSYSIRSFAKNLGVGSTSLSDFLNHKRDLSKATTSKMINALGLSEKEIQNLFNGTDQLNYSLIKESDYLSISTWQHYAILCLADMTRNKADARWIAKRLNIPIEVAQECLDRLARMGLLKIEGSIMKGTTKNLCTPTDIQSKALRTTQKDFLGLAQKSLEEVPLHLRDITSTTFPVHPKVMPTVKKAIKAFRRKFAGKFENAKGSEVYTLTIQFFPLTLPEEKD